MTYSITRRGLGRALVLAAGFAALGAGAALAAGEKIAVITPYLSQPGTQFYVEAFEARAVAMDAVVTRVPAGLFPNRKSTR